VRPVHSLIQHGRGFRRPRPSLNDKEPAHWAWPPIGRLFLTWRPATPRRCIVVSFNTARHSPRWCCVVLPLSHNLGFFRVNLFDSITGRRLDPQFRLGQDGTPGMSRLVKSRPPARKSSWGGTPGRIERPDDLRGMALGGAGAARRTGGAGLRRWWSKTVCGADADRRCARGWAAPPRVAVDAWSQDRRRKMKTASCRLRSGSRRFHCGYGGARAAPRTSL